MENKKRGASADANYGLWTLLLRTRQLMYKARERELHKCGISPLSSGVLLTVLRLGEEATPSRISRDLFLEPHSISEHLKRMEKEGLVRRVKDLERKNLVRVELTPKGVKSYNESCARESIDTMMSVLTSREQMELWRILSKLRGAALKYTGMKMKEADLYPPSNPEGLRVP